MYNDYLADRRMRKNYDMRMRERDYRNREYDYRDYRPEERDYRDYNTNYRDYDVNYRMSDTHMPYDNYRLKSGYYDNEERYHPYEYERDYKQGSEKEEWDNDLHKWCEELKQYDIFNLSKEEIIKKAKEMNVKFDNYDEKEFITTYYMLMSDFPNIYTSPQQYLSLAKMWLNDKDIKRKGSEKLCAYYYTIVKGE